MHIQLLLLLLLHFIYKQTLISLHSPHLYFFNRYRMFLSVTTTIINVYLANDLCRKKKYLRNSDSVLKICSHFSSKIIQFSHSANRHFRFRLIKCKAQEPALKYEFFNLKKLLSLEIFLFPANSQPHHTKVKSVMKMKTFTL